MQAHDRWDVALKLLAITWAALFFFYKILAGSLTAATSLLVTATPVYCEEKTCGLISVTLERGENWGVYVNQAEITIVIDGKRSQPIPVQYKHPGRETFELSPGEKAQYGAVVELPAGKPALIEALFVIQQKRWWSNPAYVFGSVAVAPLSKFSMQ